MRHILRKVVDYVMFGWSEPDELPQLTAEQQFLLREFRLGLISEHDWRDLLDREPNLYAHFKIKGVLEHLDDDLR